MWSFLNRKISLKHGLGLRVCLKGPAALVVGATVVAYSCKRQHSVTFPSTQLALSEHTDDIITGSKVSKEDFDNSGTRIDSTQEVSAECRSGPRAHSDLVSDWQARYSEL